MSPPGLARLAEVPASAWLAVAAVLLLRWPIARLGLWPYALFVLPGTLAHEAAHWLVARVTGARPHWPRLWPERGVDGWRLGAVAFRPAWWRTGAIALAPLVLAPLALWWTAVQVADAAGALRLLHAWIAGSLLGASLPSRADLRLALPTLALLGMLVAAAILLHALAR